MEERPSQQEHHRRQSRQRLDSALFSRWQVHRLPRPAASGIRERPLPADAVRPQDGREEESDGELRWMGGNICLDAGLEHSFTSLPRYEEEAPIFRWTSIVPGAAAGLQSEKSSRPRRLIDDLSTAPTMAAGYLLETSPGTQFRWFTDDLAVTPTDTLYRHAWIFDRFSSSQVHMSPRETIRRSSANHACVRDNTRELTHLNDAVLSPSRHVAARTFLVRRSSRRQGPRLPRQAAELRCLQEVSREVPHPRRPARALGETTGRIAGIPNSLPPTDTWSS